MDVIKNIIKKIRSMLECKCQCDACMHPEKYSHKKFIFSVDCIDGTHITFTDEIRGSVLHGPRHTAVFLLVTPEERARDRTRAICDHGFAINDTFYSPMYILKASVRPASKGELS